MNTWGKIKCKVANYRESNKREEKRSRILWITLGVFIVITFFILLRSQKMVFDAKKEQLVVDAKSTAEMIKFRLQGNEDYLILLAKERSENSLDKNSFQERGSQYVSDHPELICINWVDENFRIIDVAPLNPNKEIIGLRLDLPEPKRASQLAKETHHPVYTKPFVVIQGALAFEVWVPVYDGDVFLGLFGGIYSFNKILNNIVTPHILQIDNISIVNESGDTLLALSPTDSIDKRITYQVPLPQSQNDIYLRFNGYGPGVLENTLMALEILCILFVLGIIYISWKLLNESKKSKRVKETLVEHDILFESVVMAMSEGLSVQLQNGEIAAVNPAAEKIEGRSSNEIVGHTSEDSQCDAIYEDGSPFPGRLHPSMQTLETGEPKTNVVMGIHQPDKKLVWISINSVPLIKPGESKPYAVVTTFRDITEQKANEEKLTLLNFAINNVQEAAFLTDGNAAFQFVNDGACKMLGFSRSELKNLRVPDIDPTFPIERWSSHWNELKSKRSLIFESLHKTKDGRIFPVEINANYFKYNDQAFNLALVRDISDRKQLEEQINKLNEDLEKRVMDRTNQLAAANKELETFCYTVSHNLRSPLRHINGYINLIKEDIVSTLDDQHKYYLTSVSDSANEMDSLINDLLTFSKMGRKEFLTSVVDLNKMIKNVIKEFKLETSERDITWNIATFPEVVGDEAMLHEVMANLISNALKYTRLQEKAFIEIGYRNEVETEVVVYIRDNGVGFNMKYSDKLFGVFQRLHSSEEFEGTGIGLAIVQQIINRLGGKTWAEGTEGQGATFYFSIPLPS